MGDTWVTDMTCFEGILDPDVEVPERAGAEGPGLTFLDRLGGGEEGQ